MFFARSSGLIDGKERRSRLFSRRRDTAVSLDLWLRSRLLELSKRGGEVSCANGERDLSRFCSADGACAGAVGEDIRLAVRSCSSRD